MMYRGGRQRGRQRQAGTRSQDAGDPADPRQDLERREREQRQNPRQSGNRRPRARAGLRDAQGLRRRPAALRKNRDYDRCRRRRSEEHTSELQSLMRISYAVFCLKKKNTIILNSLKSISTTTSPVQPTRPNASVKT